VLYAGEVNWDMAGLEGRARSIEQALKAGDPGAGPGHQGTRSVTRARGSRAMSPSPDGTLSTCRTGNTSGISRKLSDVERKRLRDVLKTLIPEGAGVIVAYRRRGSQRGRRCPRDVTRTAGAVGRHRVEGRGRQRAGPALRVSPISSSGSFRDLFNEDFRELVVQGTDAYDMVDSYLSHVSPDLVERLRRHAGTQDVFATYRIDEQILQGLDRKVFLPSGGSLVIATAPRP